MAESGESWLGGGSSGAAGTRHIGRLQSSLIDFSTTVHSIGCG